MKKVGIVTSALLLMVKASFAQFGSAIVPETPTGGPLSGDNTVLCAYITRQCQLRCGERKRLGKYQIQYVQWAVNIQQTLVSCNTYEAINVPIFPSSSQTNIAFNVPCCPKNASQSATVQVPPITTTTERTTERSTPPPVIKFPSPICPSPSSGVESTQIETQVFTSLLFSAISAGLTLMMCFLVILLLCMIRKLRRHKSSKLESQSPSFVYKNMLNPDENRTSKKSDNNETSRYMSTGKPPTKRPLPEFPNESGTIRNDYKEEVVLHQNVNKSPSNNFSFQPIDSVPESLLTQNNFDSNLPSRRVTVNEPVSEKRPDILLDRRHDSMPGSKSSKNKDTQTEDNTLKVYSGHINPDSYVYCQLGSDSKIIRSKGEYSLLRLSKNNKMAKRQSVPSLLSEEKCFEYNEQRYDPFTTEATYLNTNSNMKISDYVDVETSYVKTMSPKTNKIPAKGMIKSDLAMGDKASKTGGESTYVFADDIKKLKDNANPIKVATHHNHSIEYKYSDGTTLTLAETEDL